MFNLPPILIHTYEFDESIFENSADLDEVFEASAIPISTARQIAVGNIIRRDVNILIYLISEKFCAGLLLNSPNLFLMCLLEGPVQMRPA
jgi:hypothetical protein